MKRTPYIGFGNDTLDKCPVLAIGQNIICPHCEERHRVYGGKDEDGKEQDTLMFYKCGEHIYICGVHGRSVLGVKPDASGKLGEE